MIFLLLGIAVASLAIASDPVKAGGYGPGEPAALTSNTTGNMTGLSGQGIPIANTTGLGAPTKGGYDFDTGPL